MTQFSLSAYYTAQKCLFTESSLSAFLLVNWNCESYSENSDFGWKHVKGFVKMCCKLSCGY